MRNPSTAWREVVQPDEEARYERQGRVLARLQADISARSGNGRALHRKAVLAVAGHLEVLPGLPPHASFGLFATAGRHPVLVRLSNGAARVESNRKPDIRGFAIKVLELAGESSLGGQTDHQDFLLINHDSFASRTSDEFMAIVEAAPKGPPALIAALVRRHGLIKGFGKLRQLAGVIGKPFRGFATETFNTCLPIAVGPYAARVILKPLAADPARDPDPEQDFRARLAAGPVDYELALQFFVDEAITPIEDPTRVWPVDESPWSTVAKLSLSAVHPGVEDLRFDPWGGLAAHRPLGEIMRARKAAYYVSHQGRGAA